MRDGASGQRPLRHFLLATGQAVSYKLRPMKTKLLCLLALLAFSLSTVRAAEAMDEKSFQKLMKEVGKASKAMKDNATAKNAAVVQKDATRVAEIYTQMAGFWKARKTDDAVKWSEDSATAATATAAAAQAGDWDKVKTSWSGVGKNCKACHEKHQDKQEDGSYKIK